mmetsp:Transcript_28451/g.53761  ORF Transcript_28451/g.53761 Transcript_28451/m.53761 type:complete len:219 (-) Transcript_28451:50-706(-)
MVVVVRLGVALRGLGTAGERRLYGLTNRLRLLLGVFFPPEGVTAVPSNNDILLLCPPTTTPASRSPTSERRALFSDATDTDTDDDFCGFARPALSANLSVEMVSSKYASLGLTQNTIANAPFSPSNAGLSNWVSLDSRKGGMSTPLVPPRQLMTRESTRRDSLILPFFLVVFFWWWDGIRWRGSVYVFWRGGGRCCISALCVLSDPARSTRVRVDVVE